MSVSTASIDLPARPVPSGPRGYPVVGLIPDLARDILGTYRRASAYGEMVALPMGPTTGYLVTHPDHMKHVLQDNYRNYTKGQQMDVIRPLLGNGLFLSEGEFWFQQRRLMQPAFYRPALSGLTDIMTDATNIVINRWDAYPPEKSFNIMAEMRHITQTVIVRAMFSTSISREDTNSAGNALDFVLTTLVERAIVPFSAPEWLPTAKNRRLRASMQTLNALVNRFIEERRRLVANTPDGIDPSGDLLSMLMNVRYEDTGGGMTDQQLRDEVMTMFLAGHETTATSLAWVWILLSRHPQVEAKLHAELDRVLGGRMPTFEDLKNLPYTNMVIQETMRIYPPVWMTARQAIADDVVGGYYVPAGSLLLLAIYLLHSNPAYWENPEQFNPERFAPENAEKIGRFTYLPFGRGPRTCIGEHFAMMEAALVLAMIAQRYYVRLAAGQEVKMRPMGALQPLNGPLVTLQPRN